MLQPAPVLARLVRNGVVESVHCGHVAVATTDGEAVASLGDRDHPTYVRSAAKPFQALASLDLLEAAGVAIDDVGLAVACASHTGTDIHQIEAAHLLALAGLDEQALRCPAALPDDLPTMLDQRVPSPLAHNCSGKHAAFLFAHTAGGADPATYLATGAPLQRRALEHLATVTGTVPTGPGVDGCGAPAWVLPLGGLATGFARLAAAPEGALARVRRAMRARPDLVGGADTPDTALMVASEGVVAKRGAEGLLAAGWVDRAGRALGVAVKVDDGARRATGPIVAALLAALGVAVPADLLAIPVLGGGRRQGELRADPAVTTLGTRAGT